MNALLASVLTVKTNLQEVKENVWRKWDSPQKDWVREHLDSLDTHKSMGPYKMHPRRLKKPADVIAKPLSLIFEW